MPSAGEDEEKWGGNVWGRDSQKQFDSFLKAQTFTYHTTHQSHSWVFTQEKYRNMFTEKPAHKCNSYIHNHQKQKQPKCPLAGEWINKIWYIQTMEYQTEEKRNELLTHAATLQDPKGMMLSGRSHAQKATHCVIPLT